MSDQDITPIFIFSLPRSGSTLLQRAIASAPDVATVSEPWFLLAPFHALKQDVCYGEYGHQDMVVATEDFLSKLPQGRKDYFSSVESFALSLYRKAAGENKKFFLDKTPRYHLIAQEIIDTFPNGKFIFLWRNPVSVISSIMETWDSGRWNLYAFYVDLYKGIENLISVYQQNSDKVISIKYEDLLLSPKNEFQKIFEYIGSEGGFADVAGFSDVRLDGKMGDPTGVKQYQSLNAKSIDKWKVYLRNPLRKFWVSRYIRQLGAERMGVMGYSMENTIFQLRRNKLGMKWMLSDIVRLAYGFVFRYFDLKVFAQKVKGIRKKPKSYANM